jgi:CRP-like cAMP-binding protein
VRKALVFLGVLTDTDVDWLISAGERQRVDPGAVLIRQGLPISTVYIVLDGSFGVTVAADGREVARLRSGEIVGELSFVDARPPSATVTAVEPSVVLAVPRAPLEHRLQTGAPFAARFYRALAVLLADRLRSTTARLAYGDPAADADEELEDELEPAVLERVAVAGARFDWLLRRLREF